MQIRSLTLILGAILCAASAYGTIRHVPSDFSTITAAVGGSNDGDTILVAAGTYADNVIVTKRLTLTGAGPGLTKLMPAFSAPDPGGSGSLPAGASNLMLVQADDVTISGFTLDGDNPGLTSGYIFGGADIDARNGVITDHNLGVYSGLEVFNCEVKNIYLRGVYASSGGTFDFHDNTVRNVRGSTQSIALFNFGGSGKFANNTVSDCNDGISSNHSKGIKFFDNIISGCGSGIHTDNAGDAGGVADSIVGNQISNSATNGYGIFVFAPYLPPVVYNNTITNVEVGLTCAGAYVPVTVEFKGNTIDAAGRYNSTGIYVTTQVWGFASGNVSAVYRDNVVANAVYGAVLESQAGFTNSLVLSGNSISGIQTAGVFKESGALGAGTFNIDASRNWWGTTDAAMVGSGIAAGVDYTPYLDSGVDSDPMTPGFQASLASLWVDINSPQIGTIGRIQEGVNLAGTTVHIASGTYEEQVEIAKAISIEGQGASFTKIASPFNLPLSFLTGSTPNFAVIYAHDADNIGVSNLTVDGQGYGGSNYRFVGIGYRNAGGAITNVTVKDFREDPMNGNQHGVGIYSNDDAAPNRQLNISGCTVTGFQKNGMALNGAYLATTVANCTVTGSGPTTVIAQNGIQIGFGATGSLSHNQISQVSYTGNTGDGSSGILAYSSGQSIISLGNTVTNCQMGVNYINVGGMIDSNVVSATQSGTGLTSYWAIIADPKDGSLGRVASSPIDKPAKGQPGYDMATRMPNVIITTATGNNMNGDGVGYGLFALAAGTQTMTFGAYGNTSRHFAGGIALAKDAGATLNATLTSNLLTDNVYGLQCEPGAKVTARSNLFSNTTNADDPTALNTYDGNCWSDYSGDGPYRVGGAGVNFDLHPKLYGVNLVGDLNGDHLRDIGDMTFIMDYLFYNLTPPKPLARGDLDCSGQVDITDVTWMVTWLFFNGQPPCNMNCM